jgi:hypothetical protein
MSQFSFLEASFENFAEHNKGGLFPSGLEFAAKQRTEDARKMRLKKIVNDYWAFDKIYFPPELYQDGYSEPNAMHKYIVHKVTVPGIHVIFGPRKFGKSPTGRKAALWMMLTGRWQFPIVFSEDLLTASAMMTDIWALLAQNPRLQFDFKPKFITANTNELLFTFEKIDGTHTRCFVAEFSYRRSARGHTKLFGRPDGGVVDDPETLDSSFSHEAVKLRQDKLSELYLSMIDGATLLVFSNDFSEKSALHEWKEMHEKHLLADHITFASFRAWSDRTYKIPRTNIVVPVGCLWPQRYDVSNELELKRVLKPLDESDWLGNFQQTPTPPEGMFFIRDKYQEWDRLPNDLRSVLYCDPNLSKKSKGDSTAAVGFGYSPKEDYYFFPQIRCRSYSDSNDLLLDILKMREQNRYAALAFDGNVSQESSWTQHVKNFCLINKTAYPVIDYKHYHVNDLSKNFQLIYNDRKVYFPKGFSNTEEGKKFLAQFFAFTGIKLNKADDGPDGAICAHEFLTERKFTKTNSSGVQVVPDYY